MQRARGVLRFVGGLVLMLGLLAVVSSPTVAQDRPGATPVAEPLGGIELTKTFDPPFIPTESNAACFRVEGRAGTEMCLDADDATTPGDFSSYTIQFNDLPAGYYYLTEYDTPAGYFSDELGRSILVNPGEESAVTINNSTTPYRGIIRVSKRVCAVTPDGVTAANADGPICPGPDEATDPTVAGTEFVFTVHQGHEDTSSSSAPVQTITVTIGQTGYGSTTGQSLPQGQYTVCEQETPGFQAAPRPNFLGEYVPGQPCLRTVVSPNGESTAFFANFRVAMTDPDLEPTTETPGDPTAPKPAVTATEEATTIAQQRNGRDDEQVPSGNAVVSTMPATPTTTTTPQATQPVPSAVTVLPNTGGGVVNGGANPRALLVLASLSGLLIAGAVWQIRRSDR